MHRSEGFSGRSFLADRRSGDIRKRRSAGRRRRRWHRYRDLMDTVTERAKCDQTEPSRRLPDLPHKNILESDDLAKAPTTIIAHRHNRD